jgi:class 3 adenylate cyclase
MNPFSIPSLICAVLFFFLCIAVVSYNPKEKLNTIVGILSFNWTLLSLAVFMLHSAEELSQAVFWNRWPYALFVPSTVLLIYYFIALNKLDTNWQKRVLYLPLKAHFLFATGLATFLWVAATFSDLMIAPPEYHPVTGFEHSYGPVFIVFALYATYALVLCIAVFRHGIKSAEDPLAKGKIAFSGWGLFIGLFFAFLLATILPLFGIQSHSLSMVPFAWIAMCFIYAIIKYQYLEIQRNVEVIEKTSRLKGYLSPQVVETIMSGQDKELALKNERREVTIFFSDLRGFTNFSDRVEPEEVLELLKKYHAKMGEVIFNYDGTLERFAGDGMMVISGAPVPHEDHALRAVKMALEMKAEVEELKKEWERKDYDLDIGMGISSGYATIGTVGFEGRMDYTAIGKVTNLAARLCEDAQAGQILISKSTFLHVENQIKAIEIGEKDFKGFQQPITTYEVIKLV